MARTSIIKMLNKSAKYDKSKSPNFAGITYPHVWEDVDETNHTYRIDRKLFLRSREKSYGDKHRYAGDDAWGLRYDWLQNENHNLPPDLSFGDKPIINSEEIHSELKDMLNEEINKPTEKETNVIHETINEILYEKGSEPLKENSTNLTSKIDEAVNLEKTIETGVLPNEFENKKKEIESNDNAEEPDLKGEEPDVKEEEPDVKEEEPDVKEEEPAPVPLSDKDIFGGRRKKRKSQKRKQLKKRLSKRRYT